MSGLYKSFPPIPPRPYWWTHEVSTKIANNLLIYKHFLNACHLFTLALAKTTARPTPSVRPLKPPFPCHPLRNPTSGTLFPAYIYPQTRFSVPSSWRKPLQKIISQPHSPQLLLQTHAICKHNLQHIRHLLSPQTTKNKPRNLILCLQGLPDLT